MKKIIIGAIVGGLLIFIWQTLSNTVLDLHRPAQQYTSKQDTIMSFLNSQFNSDGQYFMPYYPETASSEEMENAMKSAAGKPWAMVSYHASMNTDMTMNIVRTYLVDFIIVLLLGWILVKINGAGFATIFVSTLFVGLISYFNSFYTQHIWYENPGQNGYLTDALVSWGLCGIWLGWWLRR